MPAAIAAVCPKFRRNWIATTRESARASSSRIWKLWSELPSSTQISSHERPTGAMAAAISACSVRRLSASLYTGTTMDTSTAASRDAMIGASGHRMRGPGGRAAGPPRGEHAGVVRFLEQVLITFVEEEQPPAPLADRDQPPEERHHERRPVHEPLQGQHPRLDLEEQAETPGPAVLSPHVHGAHPRLVHLGEDAVEGFHVMVVPARRGFVLEHDAHRLHPQREVQVLVTVAGKPFVEAARRLEIGPQHRDVPRDDMVRRHAAPAAHGEIRAHLFDPHE